MRSSSSGDGRSGSDARRESMQTVVFRDDAWSGCPDLLPFPNGPFPRARAPALPRLPFCCEAPLPVRY
jgi:hypothetical protein